MSYKNKPVEPEPVNVVNRPPADTLEVGAEFTVQVEAPMHVKIARAMMYDCPISPRVRMMAARRPGYEVSVDFKNALMYSITALKAMRTITPAMLERAQRLLIERGVPVDSQTLGDAWAYAIDVALVGALTYHHEDALSNLEEDEPADTAMTNPAGQPMKWGE